MKHDTFRLGMRALQSSISKAETLALIEAQREGKSIRQAAELQWKISRIERYAAINFLDFCAIHVRPEYGPGRGFAHCDDL